MRILNANKFLLIATISTCGTSAWANLTIDNFHDSTTYVYTASGYTTSGVTNADYQTSLTTTDTIGGNRKIALFISNPTTYFEPITLRIGNTGTSPATYRFIQDAGYNVFPQTTLKYGETSYLGQDFTPYSKLRINFEGVDSAINVTVTMFSDGVSKYRALTSNVSASNSSFFQDFIFSNFSGSAGTFSWNAVNVINVQITPAATLGSNDFAITSIEAI